MNLLQPASRTARSMKGGENMAMPPMGTTTASTDCFPRALVNVAIRNDS